MNRKIIEALSPALIDGKVKGNVGNIDLSKVTTAAITNALELVVPEVSLTDTAQKLVYTGKALKSLREAIIQQNWDAVLVMEAYKNDGDVLKVAEAELELLCDEIVDRKSAIAHRRAICWQN